MERSTLTQSGHSVCETPSGTADPSCEQPPDPTDTIIMRGSVARFKSEMRLRPRSGAEFFNSYFFGGHLMSVS